jgi:hypothetical protein
MMRPGASIAIGVAALLSSLALAAAAQEPNHDEVLGKLLGSLQAIGKTLEGVTDEATATSARPELKKQAEELVQTRKLSEQVPPPSPEAREKIAKDWQPKFVEVRKVLEAQIARVQRVPGGKATLDELKSVFEPTEKK